MAAESLAWDLDLEYTKQDFDRLIEHWGQSSEVLLFLQSKDQGKTIIYGKPFFYPLLAAPLTRLMPRKGALVLNLVLLWLAAWTALRALRPTLGRMTAVWIAVFLFSSVAWTYSFWAHADLFLMSLVAIGLALALDARERANGDQIFRWLIAGACLAIVGFSRPFYLTLFLPAYFIADGPSRWKSRAALFAAAAAIIGTAALIHWDLGGSLTSYTGDRKGFYARTGLPEIDFPADAWGARDSAFVSWHEASKPLEQETDASLWAWNGVYLLAGEHIGLLPYFLPFALGLLAARGDRIRWSLAVAVLVSLAALLLYRPFNFYGGGATIANRYFLPLYPAFWYLVARPRKVLWPIVITLVAAPFLWPVWSQPGAYPLRENLTYRFVSPVARWLLPFETTQSHVKPSGQEDVMHNGLWVRMLNPNVRALDVHDWRSEEFEVSSRTRTELLLASKEPVSDLDLTVVNGHGSSLEIQQAEMLDRTPTRDGETRYRVRLGRPRARHPMWWTWDRLNLYRLGVRLDSDRNSSLRFRLEPVAESKDAS